MQQYLKIGYIIIAAATSWLGCNEKADNNIEEQAESYKASPVTAPPADSSQFYGIDAQGMIFLYPSVI